MITARDEQSDKLLGWMFVNLELPEIGFISDWHPVVHPDLEQDEVAVGLITHAKTLVKTHSRTRLEIWFNLKNKALKDMSSTYITWYEQSGFNLVEEEDVMTNNPTKSNIPSLPVPDGIELVSLRKVTNEALKDVVLETLQDDEGGWLTD
jgi:hypothetical protein